MALPMIGGMRVNESMRSAAGVIFPRYAHRRGGVSFTVICDVDTMDGTDRLSVLFPTAPCCPKTRRFRGAAHLSAGRVGWHWNAIKCEGLTIDHQLMKRSVWYPKASLDWAWGEFLAGRAVPDPFFTCVARCCFLYGEGRRIGPRALSLGRR